jgi:ankyrin repeat protein
VCLRCCCVPPYGSAKGWQLIDAAEAGDLARVAALLEGPDPPYLEAKDTQGFTALYRAAQGGKSVVVALLLWRGANVEAKGDRGTTALLVAAANGHSEVVARLREEGADIEAKTNLGTMALLAAAANGHREVVALLLGWGSPIDSRDNKGWTPVIHAAANGHQEVVALLLKRGADAGACDAARHQTAEQWARTDEIKELLRVSRWPRLGPAGVGAMKGRDGAEMLVLLSSEAE